ncbi:MAG: hypothetical protein EBU68_01275 [Actinobacteria bacterium]|nr:hypothetical protein [Actinomycetota bacterium]
MSRRLDIELTSARDDGMWTWRAAGAKVPKGVVESTLLPGESKVGDVLKIEADFDIDGITVLSVVPQRDKSQKATFLQLIDDKPFTGVTEKLAKKAKSDRPQRDKRGPRTDRPDRNENSDRKPRSERPPRQREPRNSENKATAPVVQIPERPAAKRLKPNRKHRSAVLQSLPTEQRSVAERALSGGIRAVREAIKTQNAQLKAEGKSEIKADGLISMAQDILPKLRVAEWLDKAEAAKRDLAVLDLRDLRAVVVGADDPMVVRDETTRELAGELKVALKQRQETEMTQWLDDIKLALSASRVLRAIKLSGEPPKAGVLFPVDLGQQLAKAAADSLSNEASSDRWIAVLEALAFSPIRTAVKPLGAPQATTDALRATVKRLAPLVPQIASLFAIEVSPGAQTPRPLRTPRPKRDFKRKPKTAKVPDTSADVTN